VDLSSQESSLAAFYTKFTAQEYCQLSEVRMCIAKREQKVSRLGLSKSLVHLFTISKLPQITKPKPTPFPAGTSGGFFVSANKWWEDKGGEMALSPKSPALHGLRRLNFNVQARTD
jgi:hypothetical protein